ncbi:30S ribosome-binding factor RbfA [Polymorphobacter fuscus]|uniref:Ribosome-binding factor A n=1 Tax=Sandarakinorhabdus fusca TaxID=1439888 RepID=A0A7C9KNX5_9SPHN|nr:30S ribosome-binding factor RbfA [Polymorphobacter fuscus]KAB7644812.1 30S ribosome-binding factor RbfA [Polymorphobacter fuscus]MQT18084.1 30S ribosome-binding factor RbfA [Polymorphobacter fuscus]NJC09402.1 ribosome-binding factor A [Polymorphobacter fuscus]
MKATPDEKGRSIRLQRIGEQVRHAIAEIIGRGELRDELLQRTIVSVSEVRVTADLRHATVFIKALGGGDDQAVVKALASHARFLRGEVARKMATKYTPDLRFRADESFDAGARIDAILRRPSIARDLEPDAKPRRLSDIRDEEGDDD